MSVDLRLGDCLALGGLAALGAGAVDVTITDPPFDARTHRAALEQGARVEGQRTVGAALPFPPLDDDGVRRVAGELARVTRRWIVVFTGERQAETWAVALELAGARFVRLGVVVKDNPRPQMTGDRPGPGCELLVIAYSGTGRMKWNGGGRAGVWRMGQARLDDGGQVHPTQKPVRLMEQLVGDFSDPGELVVDPFGGSGTTALACARSGRRFLGWERDPVFHAAAIRRLDGVREQLTLGVLG